jgi:hypothetical protein
MNFFLQCMIAMLCVIAIHLPQEGCVLGLQLLIWL